jgi:hypothetical protein
MTQRIRITDTLALLACLLLATSCASTKHHTQDSTARLIARPDFKPAVQAAPEWVRDALRTITQLEARPTTTP